MNDTSMDLIGMAKGSNVEYVIHCFRLVLFHIDQKEKERKRTHCRNVAPLPPVDDDATNRG